MSTYEQKWWKFLAESEVLASQEDKNRIIDFLKHPDFEFQMQGFELANILLTEYIARAEEMALYGYDDGSSSRYNRHQGLIKDLYLNYVDTDWDGPSFDDLTDIEKTPENLAKLLGVSAGAVEAMNTFRSKAKSVTNIQELKEAIKDFYLLSDKLKEDRVPIDDDIFAPRFSYSEPYRPIPLKELFSDAWNGYTNFDLYWVRPYLKKILELENQKEYHGIGDVPF